MKILGAILLAIGISLMCISFFGRTWLERKGKWEIFSVVSMGWTCVSLIICMFALAT